MFTDLNNLPPEARQEATKMEVAKYDTRPLPIKHITGIEELVLTWKDFSQDESAESVYLFRGFDSPYIDENRLHLPKGVNEMGEIVALSNGKSMIEVANKDTAITESPSGLTMHTSRNKTVSEGFTGDYGTLVRYKIPKAWILENTDRIFIGNIGEDEIDIVGGLPQEFIDNIEKSNNSHAQQNGLPEIINI